MKEGRGGSRHWNLGERRREDVGSG